MYIIIIALHNEANSDSVPQKKHSRSESYADTSFMQPLRSLLLCTQRYKYTKGYIVATDRTVNEPLSVVSEGQIHERYYTKGANKVQFALFSASVCNYPCGKV